MKKILFTLALSTFVIVNCFAQIMQASIGAGSTSRSIKIYIKTSAPLATPLQISTVQFNIAIPSTFTPVPTATFTANTTFLSTVVWGISPPVVEDGYLHYMITNNGAPIYSKLDGTETEVLELTFSGNGTTNFRLVTLPEGGVAATGGNALFFCSSSTYNSDGSNLYYTRPGTTVLNGFSYRGGTGVLGDAISYAELTAPIVLPVKFTSFNAVKKDNDALLTWAVENEDSNTDLYEVERSIDGVTFEKVTTLAKANNTNISNIYNTTDANLSLLKNSGVIYYRIKQIDKNGRSTYSEVRTVKMVDKAGISAFPNPVKDFTTVKIDLLEATDVNIVLVNADGKQILATTMQAQKGVNLKRVDMSNFASGNYTLKASIGDEIKTISVIKL
jgi:Secretion system C-terminal sorting domain